MFFYSISVIFLLMISSHTFAEEIFARTQMLGGTASLIGEKDSKWDESCSLELVVSYWQVEHRAQLRHPIVYCSLYGPVQIVSSETKDGNASLIFVEASRGGDGDHTGILIQAFWISQKEFKKLGEVELFSASYIRRRQKIQAIEGELQFSFSPSSPNLHYTNSRDDIYVPVRVTVDRSGLKVRTTATSAERKAIWRHFRMRRDGAKYDFGTDVDITALESALRAALRMK